MSNPFQQNQVHYPLLPLLPLLPPLFFSPPDFHHPTHHYHHHHHPFSRHANWSATVLRFIVRMGCCCRPFHSVLASLPLQLPSVDRRFTDYFYSLLKNDTLTTTVNNVYFEEFNTYELLHYPNEPTSCVRYTGKSMLLLLLLFVVVAATICLFFDCTLF